MTNKEKWKKLQKLPKNFRPKTVMTLCEIISTWKGDNSKLWQYILHYYVDENPTVTISNVAMMDKELEILLKLKPQVKRLLLYGNMLSNRSCRIISQQETIVELDLSHNMVEDEGLEYLSKMKNLQYLQLSGNPLTNKGCKYLKQMPHLILLDLNGVWISMEQKEQIQKTLPNTTINY